MDKPTSAQTRRITDYARGHQGTASRAGHTLGHETTHALTYGSETREGSWVTVDPSDRMSTYLGLEVVANRERPSSGALASITWEERA